MVEFNIWSDGYDRDCEGLQIEPGTELEVWSPLACGFTEEGVWKDIQFTCNGC